VGFSSHWRDWALLIVTAPRRRLILAVMRNEQTRPGRRVQADEAADAIRAVAAL